MHSYCKTQRQLQQTGASTKPQSYSYVLSCCLNYKGKHHLYIGNTVYVKMTIHSKMQQIGIKRLLTRRRENGMTISTTRQMYCCNHVFVAT